MPTTITTADFVAYPHERCPYCGEHTLCLEFDEWDAATGAPTETGTHVHCTNENEADPRDHSEMPYVYWLPVQVRAARWAAEHIVIADRDDRKELATWNAGEPLRMSEETNAAAGLIAEIERLRTDNAELRASAELMQQQWQDLVSANAGQRRLLDLAQAEIATLRDAHAAVMAWLDVRGAALPAAWRDELRAALTP